MNQCSKSLPSISALNTNSILLEPEMPSPNKNVHDDDNDESLTDVSVLIQTKPSSINSDPTTLYSNTSIEYDPTIQTDHSIHNQLFQSLLAYANSFHSHETISSIQDFKNQFDSTNSIKKYKLKRHNSSKLIPSHFFSPQRSEDYNSDENTTITNASKFDWENLQKFSSPIIIREKTKHRFLPAHIDLQILRSSTPIIVREVIPKPSSSKPPIIPKYKINNQRISSIKHYPNQQSQKLIIAYDQVNVTLDKNIKQTKEIKHVNSNEYVQQYRSSLYSKDISHNLYTNILF